MLIRNSCIEGHDHFVELLFLEGEAIFIEDFRG